MVGERVLSESDGTIAMRELPCYTPRLLPPKSAVCRHGAVVNASLQVRQAEISDIRSAVALHREVLKVEFLARCGNRYLRRYYRAWIESPGALSLVAIDGDGALCGVLLGAFDPGRHVKAMVKSHGVALGILLVGYAFTHPRFGKELFLTRWKRYALGIWRVARGSFTKRRDVIETSRSPAAPSVGEITHLLVSESHQGSGIGRLLVNEAESIAQLHGVAEMTLVTPPDMAARQFYEHLGWEFGGTLTSRSGEEFVKYRHLITKSPGQQPY